MTGSKKKKKKKQDDIFGFLKLGTLPEQLSTTKMFCCGNDFNLDKKTKRN